MRNRRLFRIIEAKPSDSENDFEDTFIKRLQETAREVKASRETGARHMVFQEMLQHA